MNGSSPLLQSTDRGLYCEDGDFYIDPWLPVERAVITHAHSDHARPGSYSYLTSSAGVSVLRLRVGEDAVIQSLPYGESLNMGGVDVSLHCAGHILGSSQVRLERSGEIWVVSGDYKIEPDRTADVFETVRCHTFITESTFGLPIYRWKPQREIFKEIDEWRAQNAQRGWTSILYAYALGKAQRILAGIDPDSAPLAAHGAVLRVLPCYKEAGISLPKVLAATIETLNEIKGKGLVIAPPSASGSTWARKFEPASEAFASGWMQIRGARRRRNVDRGFVLSDHADWNGLLETIKSTGAQRIGVTHGYTDTLTRYLREHGLEAWTVPTRYTGDEDSTEDDATASAENEERLS